MPGTPNRRPRGLAGRIRAAIAYADTRDAEAAKALHVSVTTLARWKAGDTSGSQPSDEQLTSLAELTGIPLSFFLQGFDTDAVQRPAHGTSALSLVRLSARVSALEHQVKEGAADRELIAQQIEELSERIETRFGTVARRELHTDQPPAKKGGRPRPSSRKAR